MGSGDGACIESLSVCIGSEKSGPLSALIDVGSVVPGWLAAIDVGGCV